jgi:hypothetical protein
MPFIALPSYIQQKSQVTTKGNLANFLKTYAFLPPKQDAFVLFLKAQIFEIKMYQKEKQKINKELVSL